MSPPTSDLFLVTEVPGAGRGVVASGTVREATYIWQCRRPAAHVIFWEYRKEVCAQCFHYDRGRTLPVRHNMVARVFCSRECEQLWLAEQGELGYESWKNLKTFVNAKSNAVTNNHSLLDPGLKPQSETIASRWREAETVAEGWRTSRLQTVSPAGSDITAEASYRRLLHHRSAQVVDPDILGYLISGILFIWHHQVDWKEDVLRLTRDERPFRTLPELEAYCNSFLQLVTIMPVRILPYCTAELCQTLISAASHNSFGIRSGSEDGEEYLGYGLYPSASYFNHSCVPNISKARDGRSWVFTANRLLTEGEQCCISYLGGDEVDMNVCDRRARLKAYWGFECMCARCREDVRP